MAQSELDARILAGFRLQSPGDLVEEEKVEPGMAF